MAILSGTETVEDPTWREYSEINPDTGATEVWATDDSGNFRFVSEVTPGPTTETVEDQSSFDVNAYADSLIGGLPQEWQQAYNEVNTTPTATYSEQREDGSIWEISYNPETDAILGEQMVTAAPAYSMYQQNQPSFEAATGFNESNFVAPSGDGFDVYVGGQYQGNYTTQAEAEQMYNLASATTSTAEPFSFQQAFSNAILPIDYGLGLLQQDTYQGPMGLTYPAQPSFTLPSGVMAQSPISGTPSVGSPIRYQYGYEASPQIQRHEVGHVLGPDPTGIDWASIPEWAIMAAINEANTAGISPEELYDPVTKTVLNPTELAANLYALGFWNPFAAAVGSPTEETAY